METEIRVKHLVYLVVAYVLYVVYADHQWLGHLSDFLAAMGQARG